MAVRKAVQPLSLPGLWWRGKSKRFKRRFVSAAATICLLIGAGIILFPIVWMIGAALKPTRVDVLTFPPQVLPANPRWANFGDALFGRVPMMLYMANTIFYTLVAVFGEILSCSLVAFGFAYLRAPGKRFLFILIISTMLLPYQVTMVPRFIMYTQAQTFIRGLGFAHFQLIDTYWPLLLPKFFGSAYLIFLIRQFYMGIPREMLEAARIDGCSFFGLWWRIIVPMSRPVLIATGLLSFTYHWNNYLDPLIYLNSNDKLPASVGLANFTAAYGASELHLLMAATLVTLLPCLIIFFFTNRYFVQGVVVSGVKG